MKKLKSTIMLLVFFVDEKDKDKLTNILDSYDPILKFYTKGKAAGESSGDFWGFNIVDRDVVFALVPKEKSNDILTLTHNVLMLSEKHKGLAFSVPLKSASSFLFEKFKKGENDEN